MVTLLVLRDTSNKIPNLPNVSSFEISRTNSACQLEKPQSSGHTKKAPQEVDLTIPKTQYHSNSKTSFLLTCWPCWLGVEPLKFDFRPPPLQGSYLSLYGK
jgi:hypothetical protein